MIVQVMRSMFGGFKYMNGERFCSQCLPLGSIYQLTWQPACEQIYIKLGNLKRKFSIALSLDGVFCVSKARRESTSVERLMGELCELLKKVDHPKSMGRESK